MAAEKKLSFRIFSVLALLIFSFSCSYKTKTTVWKGNKLSFARGAEVSVLGSPKVTKEEIFKAISFDGVDDGLIISKNPLEGKNQFTIEVLLKPETSKSVEPRVLHIQDLENNRTTIELRLTPEKKWYLDAFLKNGKTNKGLTLIDSTKLHLLDEWYWVALRYDGKTMTSFVNGIQELSGAVEIPPNLAGDMSLGMRLNKVYWFQGKIAEIRFHDIALKAGKLKKRP